jgi:PAS domain S-box-containing protein
VSAFEQLVEAAPDAMVVTTRDGVIVLVNAQTERLFGYTRDELVGPRIEALVPERARAAHSGHRDRYTHTPSLRPMGAGLELSGRRKDGAEFPVEISLSPLVTEGGTRFVAAVRDVSARKRAEAAARAASNLLRQAVEIMDDALAVFDREGRLILHNSAYRALFPPSLGSLAGRTARELVDLAIAEAHFDDAAARERARDERNTLIERTEGTESVHYDHRTWTVRGRRTPDGQLVVTVADRTEDERRAEELRRASAAKSEFLSSMSHELRTPLNAILGFASLLHRDKKTPLTERQKEMVEHILKGGGHLLHLVDEVLDLSRIESGRMALSLEPVDPAEVLAEVVTTLHPMASRAGVELRRPPLPENLPAVFADRTRTAQILMNFGSNAIKYGRAGGQAIFTAARVESDLVRFCVRDDGIGIPADKQHAIFQPFQRAGQEAGPIEGTGIGLALSRRLAALMGGGVGFESTPGAGSAFWLDLRVHARPVERRSPRPSDEVLSPLSGGDGQRYDVVYIEDNPANVAFLRELLAEFERVTLHVAPTAEIGVELVRARRPQVVILDINLPGMNGYDAVRLLKSWPETKDIPVIALSAEAMHRDARRATAAGFYRYVTKPVNVPELIALLETLLVPESAPPPTPT